MSGRGGAGGGGPRGGPGAIDTQPGAGPDSVLGSFQRASTGLHDAGDFGYAWGRPHYPSGGTIFTSSTFTGGTTRAANRLIALRDVFGRRTRLREVALSRYSASAATDDNQIRIGLYSDSGGYPATLLWDSGVQHLFSAAAPTAGITFIPCMYTLEASTPYWLAYFYAQAIITNNVTSAHFATESLPPSVGVMLRNLNTDQNTIANSNPIPLVGWAHNLAFGAMPATFPSSAPIRIQQGTSKDILAMWAATDYP